MNIKTKNAFILLLSGKGERLFSDIHVKKQFFILDDQKLYLYPLKTALNSALFTKIVIVVDKEDYQWVKKEIFSLFPDEKILITCGGLTRNDSVYNGLKALENHQVDKVIIHDAARPFLYQSILEDLIFKLESVDSVSCYIPIYDSLFDEEEERYLKRDHKALIYTPQGFIYSKIKKIYYDGFDIDSTDDYSKALKGGLSHDLVQANPYLFKVTDAKTLEMAVLFVKVFKKYIAKISS